MYIQQLDHIESRVVDYLERLRRAKRELQAATVPGTDITTKQQPRTNRNSAAIAGVNLHPKTLLDFQTAIRSIIDEAGELLQQLSTESATQPHVNQNTSDRSPSPRQRITSVDAESVHSSDDENEGSTETNVSTLVSIATLY